MSDETFHTLMPGDIVVIKGPHSIVDATFVERIYKPIPPNYTLTDSPYDFKFIVEQSTCCGVTALITLDKNQVSESVRKIVELKVQ